MKDPLLTLLPAGPRSSSAAAAQEPSELSGSYMLKMAVKIEKESGHLATQESRLQPGATYHCKSFM